MTTQQQIVILPENSSRPAVVAFAHNLEADLILLATEEGYERWVRTEDPIFSILTRSYTRVGAYDILGRFTFQGVI